MKLPALLTLLTLPLAAQTSPPPAEDLVGALIEQLAAPKVRLRDEAQTALAEMPEAEPALRAAAESHPSEEARMRVRSLLKGFKKRMWELLHESPVQTNPEMMLAQPVRSAGDGRHFLTVSRGRAALWDAETFAEISAAEPPPPVGAPVNVNRFRRLLAMSADGKRIACTDATSQVVITETAGGAVVRAIPAETTQVTVSTLAADGTRTPRTIDRVQMPLAIELTADGGALLVLSHAGVALHLLADGTQRKLPTSEVFPEAAVPVTPRAISISGDGKLAAVGCYFQGKTDQMVMLSLPAMEVTAKIPLPHVPVALTLNGDGSEVLVSLQQGGVIQFPVSSPAARKSMRSTGMVTSLQYAPDGKSAFLAGNKPEAALCQVALNSGEAIWTAPPDKAGCFNVAFVTNDCIATTWNDGSLRVWKKRSAAGLSKPQPAR
jgi:hypothetical protein